MFILNHGDLKIRATTDKVYLEINCTSKSGILGNFAKAKLYKKYTSKIKYFKSFNKA